MEVIEAPAKLNIFLKVRGKAPNGYHLLEMLNVSISLCDLLAITADDNSDLFELTAEGEILGTAQEDLSRPENNILWKTWGAFCARFGVQCGLRIHLTKRIPVGAGLGGGTSDAAALLRFLARRYLGVAERFHEHAQLMALAQSLGADVPFSLYGGPALVSGIGEHLRPVALPALSAYSVQIIAPPVQLATADVFRSYAETQGAGASSNSSRIDADVSQKPVAELIDNDLIEAAGRLAPVLPRILLDLRGVGLACGMTGSGSALFALITHGRGDEAQSVVTIVERYNCTIISAEFLST